VREKESMFSMVEVFDQNGEGREGKENENDGQ
jgi:hypothetical protein